MSSPYNKNYSFEVWKQKKIQKGEWLSHEEFTRKKDIQRRDYLLRELELVNRRLNPRSHEELKEEFTKFEREEKEESERRKSKKRKKSEEDNLLEREIIIDTETTGLGNEDRIVEISAIELIDGIKTGRKFHRFLNPEIKIPKKAIEIHRITNEKVEDCPKFKDICEDFIKFIGNGVMIAHNSKFDMRMMNNELSRCGWEKFEETRFIDTLEIARYLFPGEKNNQDALCSRFGINNTIRAETGHHSATEDTALLYLIYQRMISLLEEQKLTPYDFKIESLS